MSVEKRIIRDIGRLPLCIGGGLAWSVRPQSGGGVRYERSTCWDRHSLHAQVLAVTASSDNIACAGNDCARQDDLQQDGQQDQKHRLADFSRQGHV
jgi:hypothetical protein